MRFLALSLLIGILLLGCSSENAETNGTIALRCRRIETTCNTNCLSRRFRACYLDATVYTDAPYDVRRHCYGVHVGDTCAPCEHIFSLSFGGAMRAVSCEEFFSALDKNAEEIGLETPDAELPKAYSHRDALVKKLLDQIVLGGRADWHMNQGPAGIDVFIGLGNGQDHAQISWDSITPEAPRGWICCADGEILELTRKEIASIEMEVQKFVGERFGYDRLESIDGMIAQASTVTLNEKGTWNNKDFLLVSVVIEEQYCVELLQFTTSYLATLTELLNEAARGTKDLPEAQLEQMRAAWRNPFEVRLYDISNGEPLLLSEARYNSTARRAFIRGLRECERRGAVGLVQQPLPSKKAD